MVKFKVLLPVNLIEEDVKLKKNDEIDLTIKRAEQIQEDVLKQPKFEDYQPIFERIEEK